MKWASKFDPQAWANIRAKGDKHFVLTRGVLGWGLPMFVLMGFFNGVWKRASSEWVSNPLEAVLLISFHTVIWFLGGGIFGAIMWHIGENRYWKAQQRHPNKET